MNDERFELSDNVMDNLFRAFYGVKENNLSRADEFILDKDDEQVFRALHKMSVDFTS